MSLRKRLNLFLENEKDTPVLVGFICGFYPLLFFLSNNYTAVNTWKHFLVMFSAFVFSSTLIVYVGYKVISNLPKFKKYKKHFLFVCLIFLTSTYLSQVLFLTFKKKVLLAILIAACLLSLKLYAEYKKIFVLICVMAVFPIFKNTVNIYEDIRETEWTSHKDDIVNIKLKYKPNIYMIQPDGYVNQQAMEKEPYSYNNKFYNWLQENQFEVYKDFRSNYPASLTSNASMFAMKHHYFDDVLFPAIEMPNAREVIINNDVAAIFKRNGYTTNFIAQDEYFQQNLKKGNYDYYNIDKKDIPFFTQGGDIVRDVFNDLKTIINKKSDTPQFFFIEKVLPHHVHFSAPENRKEAERKEYLENVEKVNDWLKEVITYINKNDDNAVIMILADHGGWVGIESMEELFSTKDEKLVHSTFSNLAAIHWNGLDHKLYDKELKSNVNVFRVLFSCLSEDTSLLDYMEVDASYNIRYENSFTKGVYKLIDENNIITYEKHK